MAGKRGTKSHYKIVNAMKVTDYRHIYWRTGGSYNERTELSGSLSLTILELHDYCDSKSNQATKQFSQFYENLSMVRQL